MLLWSYVSGKETLHKFPHTRFSETASSFYAICSFHLWSSSRWNKGVCFIYAQPLGHSFVIFHWIYFVISEIKFFKTCFYTKESVLLRGLGWVGDIKPHSPPSSAVLYGNPVWCGFELKFCTPANNDKKCIKM